MLASRLPRLLCSMLSSGGDRQHGVCSRAYLVIIFGPGFSASISRNLPGRWCEEGEEDDVEAESGGRIAGPDQSAARPVGSTFRGTEYQRSSCSVVSTGRTPISRDTALNLRHAAQCAFPGSIEWSSNHLRALDLVFLGKPLS
jgi:hypothetical protein